MITTLLSAAILVLGVSVGWRLRERKVEKRRKALYAETIKNLSEADRARIVKYLRS